MGHGLATEVGLEIPAGSVDFWGARLEKYGARLGAVETRFGEKTLPVVDPHGLRLALVEGTVRPRIGFTPWDGGPVPGEHQIRGLYGAQVWERNAEMTAEFLTSVLGFQRLGGENGWTRYGFADAAGVIDIRETPEARRGTWGVGSVHHLAWRVADDERQLAMRELLEEAGAQPTPVIDRFWFHSVYFREPGGVLFELATDGPGFAVDEDPAHLGETLVLPPWLESERGRIEAVVPPLRPPA